jgi:sugar O-acyltransferase (sialic acid O-acetyltransferase NeuD family)
MPDAVIVGAGGLGREVLDICDAAEADGSTELHLIGFVDDDVTLHQTEMLDRPVFGGMDWLRAHAMDDIRVLIAIGNPAVRQKLVRQITDIGVRFGNIIHPSVRVSRYAEIGTGTIISVNALVMSRARIGSHVYVNFAVSVAHDVVIDDFVNVAPNVALSGGVHLGRGADIGTGASIIQNLGIGEWSVVAAGAAVIRDVPANSMVAGVPAVVKKQRLPGWHATV